MLVIVKENEDMMIIDSVCDSAVPAQIMKH